MVTVSALTASIYDKLSEEDDGYRFMGLMNLVTETGQDKESAVAEAAIETSVYWV